jgi:hypothetical protein
MKNGFFDTLSKKKSFNLVVGSMCAFYGLKSQKMQANTQYFGKRFFYKQVLEFHRPSKFVCQTSLGVKTSGP